MKKLVTKSIISIFAFQFALAACAEAPNSSNPKITFPLLAECKRSVKQYLDEIPDFAGLSFRIIEFDKTIESHPSVIGYVEVETKVDTKEGLIMMFNAIKSNCYPETSTTIAINENLGGEVSNLLNINSRMGISNTYFVVDGKNLKAYYHDK